MTADDKGAGAGATIAAETADQPEVRALLAQSDAYHAGLYPAASNHLVDVGTLVRPNVRFLVARVEGGAVGCGALVLDAGGEAEIKRMFVAPEARGRRIGWQLLLALEDAARAAGVRQPESLGLYRRLGYRQRGPFGAYRADPLSTFFEKRIG